MPDESKSPEVKSRDVVSRESVFNTVVREASEFYRLVLTVATTFLGGSLLFAEKMKPLPAPQSIWILGLGWLFLIGSIVAIALTRRLNIESGRLLLGGKLAETRIKDDQTRKLSDAATACLIVGLLLVMLFGMLNVITAS